MLGEKRNLSLFASQPAQEDKQVKHITVDRDGEKKDIPLYFARTGLSSTALVILFLLPVMTALLPSKATAEKTEETVPVEPIPQDTAAGIADHSPDSDVQYPDDSPRRILASNTVVANRTHALFFAPEGDSQDFNSVLKEVQEYISGKYPPDHRWWGRGCQKSDQAVYHQVCAGPAYCGQGIVRRWTGGCPLHGNGGIWPPYQVYLRNRH